MAFITWNKVKALFGCHPEAEALLRETGEPTINIPALPRPTLKEIQRKHPWVKSVKRDNSPEGPVTLKLVPVLCRGRGRDEASISGKKHEHHYESTLDVSLGYQHLEWLLEHQDEYPAFIALLGKVHIDFPGITVLNRDGEFRIPGCGHNGGRWGYGWRSRWLGEWSDSYVRIAVARR